MNSSQPVFAIVAGPNGAGKSTAASVLLSPEVTFLNADEIAKGLPNYPSMGADMQASRILLREMDVLLESGRSLAVETTLASRSLAAKARQMQDAGYRFELIFGFLPDSELSIRRVATRVQQGGHHIPEETIRRRYRAGLVNLFKIYLPIADGWRVFDASSPPPIATLASGGLGRPTMIERPGLWDFVQERARS